MFCSKCGKQIEGEAKFCPVCGTPVEIPVVKEEQPVPVVEEKPSTPTSSTVEPAAPAASAQVETIVTPAPAASTAPEIPQPTNNYNPVPNNYYNQPMNEPYKKGSNTLFIIIVSILCTIIILLIVLLVLPDKDTSKSNNNSTSNNPINDNNVIPTESDEDEEVVPLANDEISFAGVNIAIPEGGKATVDGTDGVSVVIDDLDLVLYIEVFEPGTYNELAHKADQVEQILESKGVTDISHIPLEVSGKYGIGFYGMMNGKNWDVYIFGLDGFDFIITAVSNNTLKNEGRIRYILENSKVNSRGSKKYKSSDEVMNFNAISKLK